MISRGGSEREIDRTRFAWIMKYIPDDREASLLDLGCGPGDVANALGESFSRLTVEGLENNPNRAAFARKQPNISIVHEMSMTDIGFENEYDMVIAFASMMLLKKEEYISMPSKIYNALKEGGTFGIYDNDKYMKVEELLDLLETIGFEIKYFEERPGNPTNRYYNIAARKMR